MSDIEQQLVDAVVGAVERSRRAPFPNQRTFVAADGNEKSLIDEYARFGGERDPERCWGLLVGHDHESFWVGLTDDPDTTIHPAHLRDKQRLAVPHEALSERVRHDCAVDLCNRLPLADGARALPIIFLEAECTVDGASGEVTYRDWETSCPGAVTGQSAVRYVLVGRDQAGTFRLRLLLLDDEGFTEVSVDAWTDFGLILGRFAWADLVDIDLNCFDFSVTRAGETRTWMFDDPDDACHAALVEEGRRLIAGATT